MKIELTKEQFQGYAFSESYIEWICKSQIAVKKISDNDIIIESNKKEDIINALIFLGYAWGQQDNGR